jgi:hypothetical protein
VVTDDFAWNGAPYRSLAHLRQTGQRHRLPYWTPFMREEEDAKLLAAFRARSEPH